MYSSPRTLNLLFCQKLKVVLTSRHVNSWAIDGRSSVYTDLLTGGGAKSQGPLYKCIEFMVHRIHLLN